MRFSVKWLAALAFLSIDVAPAAPASTLDIYFIDVEGGQSTLLVSGGQSLLIDTGWAGNGQSESRPGDPAKARDANRIVAAPPEAAITPTASFPITHFPPSPHRRSI